MRAPSRLAAGLIAAALTFGQATAQARDPANPTCPASPNWSNIPSMTFNYEVIEGLRVLQAEARHDQPTPSRLEAALPEYPD